MPREKTKRPVAGAKGSGIRRHFRGRMVRANGSPRSHHIDHKPAPITFERGSTTANNGKGLTVPTSSKALGHFRVTAPTKSEHRHGIVRNATTGAQV